METDSDMDISDKDGPKYSGEVEIHETLDLPKETITSEYLDNQITHQLEDTQYSGGSEDEETYMEETLPLKSQGGTDSIIEYMYNQL